MNYLYPNEVLQRISETLTPEQRSKIIIVGSLAAAYSLSKPGRPQGVYTKDVDTMITPHAAAIITGEEVANQLLDSKWELRPDPQWGAPAPAEEPAATRPLVRLHPPGDDRWFIELMAAPDLTKAPQLQREFHPIATHHGHFSLVSFGYLGLVLHDAKESEYGVKVATPAMMALANMLHHPKVYPDLIRGDYYARPVKRSSKDLGRVVALAVLGDTEETDTWAERWWLALQSTYPRDAAALAAGAGTGLVEMLGNAEDTDQALYTCSVGLLAGLNVTTGVFGRFGALVVEEAIKPLAAMAQAPRPRPDLG